MCDSSEFTKGWSQVNNEGSWFVARPKNYCYEEQVFFLQRDVFCS